MDYEPISTDAPPGTAVIYRDELGMMTETTTRTVPWQLDDGRWVVSLCIGVGGHALERCFVRRRGAGMSGRADVVRALSRYMARDLGITSERLATGLRLAWDEGLRAGAEERCGLFDSLDAIRRALGLHADTDAPAIVAAIQGEATGRAQDAEMLSRILRPDSEGPPMALSDSIGVVREMVRGIRKISYTLGLPATIDVEAIVAAIEALKAGAPATTGDDMTGDPPPPAPEGEERWYRVSARDGCDLVVVRGGMFRWADSHDECVFSFAEKVGDWRFGERRSLRPVLPPLWAADSWTTDPLPPAPAEGSRWWGAVLNGEAHALEQESGGYLRFWVSGKPGLRFDESVPLSRTRTPIARPEWTKEGR